MELFSKKEIEGLNRIILGIHGTDSMNKMCDGVMALLPELIPHEKSFFTHKPKSDDCGNMTARSLSMTKEEISGYTEHFREFDYSAWYINQSNVAVYRDSDIVSNEVMNASYIYNQWVQPMGMRYVCGNVIRSDDRLYAEFTLFRSEKFGDYTEREMFLLSVVTDQIRLWFQKNYAAAFLPKNVSEPEFMALLTIREREIIRLVSSNLSLREISDQLSISYSTVRRHLANIYAKLGVQSRAQLMYLFWKKADL